MEYPLYLILRWEASRNVWIRIGADKTYHLADLFACGYEKGYREAKPEGKLQLRIVRWPNYPYPHELTTEETVPYIAPTKGDL